MDKFFPCPARVVFSGLPYDLECNRENAHVGAHLDPRTGKPWLYTTKPRNPTIKTRRIIRRKKP